MVNGAGLAMTTMDLVKRAGGEPANFLDIGGGAKADRVAAAMRLILADPKVEAILVNIFGGITRGDEVARGLIDARSRQEREVPMVVRIVGHERRGGRAAPRGGPLRDGGIARRGGGQGRRGRAGRRRCRVSILIGRDTRLVVHGITGREGEFHSRQMLDYGTRIVAGMTPGKGGLHAARQPGPGLRHDRRGGPPRPAPTPPASSCPRPAPRTRSWRRSARASRRSSASPRGSRPSTCCPSSRSSGPRARASSGRTAPAPRRRAGPRSGSSRARSTARARSASSPAPGRSPTRPSRR